MPEQTHSIIFELPDNPFYKASFPDPVKTVVACQPVEQNKINKAKGQDYTGNVMPRDGNIKADDRVIGAGILHADTCYYQSQEHEGIDPMPDPDPKGI
jgi:hypothetical protein